ncbi:helix-turn-helix domain-containing protein [Bacillus velezensis]|uniref:TrmB family transcriptional regulator n=1 Tax=Bacillus velezensis TaxID=492670 RepID=UPI002FFFD818
MEDVLKELQKFGFSQYECKAYIGLLKHSPVTGYEISKRSGVPRSMIYEVLGKLVDKGAVHIVPSDPVTYAPLAGKELIDRLRHDFESSFGYLEEKLLALESEQEMNVIRRISTNDHVINEMKDMIEKAEEELWLSVWEQQIPFIQEAANKRAAEQLPVFSIVFGPPKVKLGNTTNHNMSPEVAEKRMGGRLTIAARDNKEVLIANFSPQTNAWAIKSEDPALVLVAMEYMRHDLMFAELVKEVGAEKVEGLMKQNHSLFHVVTGNRFI